MPRRPLLEFEKPLVELEQQIEQIRQLARDSEVDVSQQLLQLEQKVFLVSINPLKRVTEHGQQVLDYLLLQKEDKLIFATNL